MVIQGRGGSCSVVWCHLRSDFEGCGEGVEAAGTGAGRRRWGEENTEKLLMGAVTW